MQSVDTAKMTKRPGAALITLRYAAVLHVVAILIQAVTAGQIVGGADMAGAHGVGAGPVHLFGLLQLVMAVLLWRPGRGPGWPAMASLILFLMGGVQSAIGGRGDIALHVPLGMATFGLAVAVLVGVWSSRVQRAGR
ncbi:hypothetical protein [Streptosporangium sp. KLBMP 9127]|nr:hypothetical protein [Streptosporangium sp. KLBMP 9127]